MSRPLLPASRRPSSMRPAGDMISRDQLVTWMNQRLGTTHDDFEDFRSGAEYCKLLETLRPGSLPLKKVRSGAKIEHEQMQNFKLLQQGLDKAGLDKVISIEGLISGRFRDHYELAKWFKKLSDQAQPEGGDGGPAQQAPEVQQPNGAQRGSDEPDEVRMLQELLESTTAERELYRSVLLKIRCVCRLRTVFCPCCLVAHIHEMLRALHLEGPAA